MGKKNHLMYYTDTPSAYRLLLTSSCTYTGMQVAVQQQGGKKKKIKKKTSSTSAAPGKSDLGQKGTPPAFS